MNDTAPSKRGIKINFKRHATTGFPTWRLRNERINSVLMMHHNPDLQCASDWSRRVETLLLPIRTTTEIWEGTRHQYGIAGLVSQTLLCRETSSGTTTRCMDCVLELWLWQTTGIYSRQGRYYMYQQFLINIRSRVQSKSVLQLVIGVKL